MWVWRNVPKPVGRHSIDPELSTKNSVGGPSAKVAFTYIVKGVPSVAV